MLFSTLVVETGLKDFKTFLMFLKCFFASFQITNFCPLSRFLVGFQKPKEKANLKKLQHEHILKAISKINKQIHKLYYN